MSGAVVGAYAEVGLKDTGVAAGLNGLLNQVVGFKNAFVGSIAGGAMVAGFAKLTGKILEVANSLDELRDRARETQTPIEQLSQIEFAGRLNGISDVSGMLNFLTKNLGLAASGNKELSDSFATLGIDAKSFVESGRPAISLMEQILDGLKAMPQASAAATATSVFGRGGFNVMRFGSGSEFSAAMGDARRSGATVTQAQADAADALNDEFAKAGAEIAAAWREALVPLFDPLREIISGLMIAGRFYRDIERNMLGRVLNAPSETPVSADTMSKITMFLASNAWKVGVGAEIAKTGAAIAGGQGAETAVPELLRRIAESTNATALNTRTLPDAPKFMPGSSILGDSFNSPSVEMVMRLMPRERGGDADDWNRFADAMDAVKDKQDEIDRLSRSSMPAIMDAGSFWSTAQSAIADDTKRQQLKVAQDSLERLTNIATTLEKVAENGGQALTLAP